MMDWKLEGIKGGYSFWRLPGERDVFQATKGNVPTNEAGYGSLGYIMAMKGVMGAGEMARLTTAQAQGTALDYGFD